MSGAWSGGLCVLVGENVLVAKGYRPVQRDQGFLMAPDMREWLPAEDPVWLVIALVESLDTSRLHALRRTGGVGRAGYDPDMLLTVLVWGWAQGERSSRRLQRLCSRDVAFRVICGGDAPDHVTIARFRKDAAVAIEDLFAQVLVQCARLGLARLGVVALDGVKISSDASMKANRTEEGLRKAAAAEAAAEAARAAARAAAAEHADRDAREDELFGEGEHGEQVPEPLIKPHKRAARIEEALAQLLAETAAQAAKREAAEARERARAAAEKARYDEMVARWLDSDTPPRKGKPPTEIKVEVLTRNLERARAAHQAIIDRYQAAPVKKGHVPGPVEQAQKVVRTRQALERAQATAAAKAEAEAAQAAARAEAEAAAQGSGESAKGKSAPKRNITDPDSRVMPLRGGGWLQGYNCQAVTCSDGVILATEVGNNPNDSVAFVSAMDAAVKAAAGLAPYRPATSDAATSGGTETTDDAAVNIDDTDTPTTSDAEATGGAETTSDASVSLDDTSSGDDAAGSDAAGGAGTGSDDGAGGGIGMLLADAGYLSYENLAAAGPDRLIAVGSSRDMALAARDDPAEGPPPEDATAIDAMAHRLRTPEAAALYRQRSHIAETPFGHAKHNLRFTRFTGRGITRARTDFIFHAMVHNIGKALGTGRLATVLPR